ncbi:MAG: amidohydrolase family protein [Pseudomonadales bacterium]
MTPIQALATATINPARYLSMDQDLGSVESGKLADLLIVEGNPLTDIRANARRLNCRLRRLFIRPQVHSAEVRSWRTSKLNCRLRRQFSRPQCAA